MSSPRSALEPTDSRYRATAAYLVLLAVLEYLVFSNSFSQFFQGDALFYMSHRFRSWGEFFHALYSLDVANWYRPLASQTIPSAFFPWFDLNPYGYHWVVFVLFFATTCIVFFFLRELTQSFVAAACGTTFFSIHSINVYATYDFTFAPELFYASFYLLSGIAWLRGGRSRRWYALSIVFFVLALMSKEAAVTLPGNIVLLTILFTTERPKKYVLPFFGIFAAYYLYVVRFLKVGAGDYAISIPDDLPGRIRDSFLWAFNLDHGRMHYAVIVAALLVAVFAVLSLFGDRRRYTVFGVGWFFVALSPMLGIVSYFDPRYLFLPLAGIALIVGECLEWMHSSISRWNPGIAFAVVCLMLTPFVVGARLNAQANLYTRNELGNGARIARNSAADLKRAHPTLPPGAIVYIVNPDQPLLTRFFGISALVKLVYADDTIDVRYSSLGHTISNDDRNSGKLIVMRYVSEGLVPEDNGLQIPTPSEKDFQYETSTEHILEVFPSQVAAGKGSYRIRIAGAASTNTELQYRFNEGPLAFITVRLDPNAETRFFVSNETRRGTYRFVGVRILPRTTWIKADSSVRITD